MVKRREWKWNNVQDNVPILHEDGTNVNYIINVDVVTYMLDDRLNRVHIKGE